MRFVGFSGGANFLDALPIDPQASLSGEWLDPGGLVTDVLPLDTSAPCIRRGPGQIIEQSKDSLVLLGPEVHGTRYPSEKRVLPKAKRARGAVCGHDNTAMHKNPARSALRKHLAAFPFTLRCGSIAKTAKLSLLPGLEFLAPLVTRSPEYYWMIAIPPSVTARSVLLGSGTVHAVIENRDGLWTRTIAAPPPANSPSARDMPWLCLLDDETRSYGVALQTSAAQVTLGAPLVFAEEWAFEKSGAKPAGSE